MIMFDPKMDIKEFENNLLKTREIVDFDQCMELADQDDNLFYVDEIQNGHNIRSFHYRLDIYSSFAQHGARNFRGILFDTDTKELLALPFFKFFNLFQNPMTDYKLVEKFSISQILEKADGSLIYFYMFDNCLCFRTKKTYKNDQCDITREILRSNGYLEGWIRDMLGLGYTPMFELVSPRNRIVVKYKFEDLCFLGKRDMKTGEIYSPDKCIIPPFARTVFPITGKYNNLNDIVKDCEETILDKDEIMEGYVVYFSNGEMVKIKRKQYLELFKLKDSAIRDKSIVQMLFDNTLDDVRQEFIDDNVFIDYIDLVIEAVKGTWIKWCKNTHIFWKENKDLSRKDYAIKAKDVFTEGLEFGMAMELYTSDGSSDLKKLQKSYVDKALWRNSELFKETKVQELNNN